jgi:hypothetical protein
MPTSRTPITIIRLCVGAAVVYGLLSATAQAQGTISFNRDIRPILSNNCFKCHGPDDKERKADLRLDTKDGIFAKRDGRPAVVPAKPEQSELVARITAAAASKRMPPRKSGKKLTPQEVDLLVRWVKEGASYSGHWAYSKPARPALPQVKHSSWPKNAIDYFILARLEREGLKPSPEADRPALIRRVSLDLTGLPPTLKEVDEFVNDKDPEAYDKLLDRLLAKTAYGEHWARLWLDLARYADSAGYADDPPRTIWLYRDYVIRAFNANKPLDQFTIEQVAGDLLPNPTQEQLIATAFHRNTLTNNEGGTDDEEFRNVAVVDRVNTTMAVWMGTTIACAQCHNHKYDPITQEEYFRFFAFLNNTADADRSDEAPVLSVYTDDQQRQRKQWQEEIARLEATLRAPRADVQAGQAKWEQAFPLDLKWQSVKPATAKAKSGRAATVLADNIIQVTPEAKTDTYTVEATVGATRLKALRLETFSNPAQPNDFIISRVSVTITPPTGQPLAGRFVRIEIPGKEKILSLAEVQVFQSTTNVALQGVATQSSTAFDGVAKRAIDGKTDGHYDAGSTTHTEVSDNPWWEVDLKTARPIDRIVVWNRTDPGTEERLSNFRVILLNDQRQPIWQEQVAAHPKPSATLSLSGARAIVFQTAVADYASAGFEADQVLSEKPGAKGWAVSGQTGQPHALTLIASAEIAIPAGSMLTVTIDQGSKLAKQTLGRFRVSTTDDARANDWARTPGEVVEAMRTPAAQRSPAQQEAIAQHYRTLAPELKAVRQQLSDLNQQLTELAPVTVPIMREMPQGQRRVTKIQHRGNFLDVGETVSEGTPAAFPPLPTGAPRNRLTLAKWLVDENNPLTGRVLANRFWEQIFGIGIVASSEEFGAQGELPLHPELLDWLATELIRLKWDQKAFLKLLVSSAAYRQSSLLTPELEQRDPDNRLLARGPRFRLSAEMVRDQALAVSGLLSPKMYGPPVHPLQPSLGVNAAFGSGIDWQTSEGGDRYRRALYTTWRRSNPYPSMATFDAPNREVCTVRRSRTNTPLQALVTLNDPVYIEASQALARSILAEGGRTTAEQARYAFRRCLSRPPHDNELERVVQLYERAADRLKAQPKQARRLADAQGAGQSDQDAVAQAGWTVVGNVLLNLDEMLMKR